MSPPALDRVVRTCLAKDPDDRWQSARDLKRQLRWIGEGSQAGLGDAPGAPSARVRGEPSAWALAGALALAALALGAAAPRDSAPSGPSRSMRSSFRRPRRTSSSTGDIAAPLALSPDGASVVFGAGGRLWNPVAATLRRDAHAGTEAALFPFWSPDGRQIAFFAGGKLRIVDVAGGPVRALADAPTPRGGAWGKDGIIVFSPDFRGT